jgi:K+-sensing histidine kinase KdpD
LSSRAAEDRRWGAQPSILRLNTGEVMCVPIQGREQLLGLIYLDTLVCPGELEPPRFSEDSLKLLIAMAHQTAVALENESYYAALLQKERLAAIGETTGAIAHHVKNVLQSINGGSHLVESGLASNDVSTIEKGWQIVARNQQQISQLVADMLMLGGTFEPNLEAANLNSVIRSAIKKNRLQSGFSKHEIDFETIAEQPLFRFDASAVESAVGHVIQLCQRACRHSDDRKIRVQVRDNEENVTIQITDQGMPINMGNSNAILIPLGFDESERVYGIGLAVARKIVNAHGGSIQLTQSETVGNCFLIELPRT